MIDQELSPIVMNFIINAYDFIKKGVLENHRRVADFHQAKSVLLASATLSDNEKALLDKVSLQVHYKDGMYVKNAGHYLSVGLSAIRCIDDALVKANGDNIIHSVLDLPCGYGRVLRFLRVRFPAADITASEIDSKMLAFCKHAFSVKTVASGVDFNQLSQYGKFDLIWCGSLITHLNEKASTELLRFFYSHLSPNGLCVFTTHGLFSVDSIQNQTNTYGLNPDAQKELLSRFYSKGYGYVDYYKKHGYGISLVSHEHISEMAHTVGAWRETYFMERGWDNHQDVYGYTAPSLNSEIQ
jgi:SAM-dependent methyltransferase